MMRVLAVLPLVTAYQVNERSNTLDTSEGNTYDSMKTTLKSISEMQKKGEINAETIKIVTDMIDQIRGTMKDGLACDVNTTQSMLDDAVAAVAQCDTNRNEWFDGAGFADENEKVSNASSAHYSCRADEQDECENSTAKCDAYVHRVKNWRKCTKPAGRFTHDNDDVFNYLCCMSDFFDEQVPDSGATFYDDRWECEEAYDIWCAKSLDCDGEQDDYEKAFCRRETAVENKCEAYRTCRNGAQASWAKVKENVIALEEIYQAQRVALECLICYGNNILANSTDLSSCEILPECTSLTDCPTIVYDDLPECIKCVEPDHDIPCTANFLSAQYARFEGTCTPPTQCKSCTERSGMFAQTENSTTCDPW